MIIIIKLLLSLILFTNTTFANVINNSININSIINNIEVSSTTYNNSQAIANNINISTGNNTTIKGANLEAISNHSPLEGESTIASDSDARVGGGQVNNNASGNINIEVGNNLTVESLQDEYYSKSNSTNFNVGIGVGTGDMGKFIGTGSDNSGRGNGNIGFGSSKSNTDSQWVNNQTSIIGNNSVNINVGTKEDSEGKTTITGAVIASGQYTTDEEGNTIFQDNNNLSLNTKQLDYKDINDFHTEETKGFQFSTGFGVSTNAGESAVSPKGSTTIGLTSKGQEKEQITKATIGNGNITTNIQSYTRDENGNIIGTVGGTTLDNNNQLLAGLNRDVNNSQEITKDMITGALDASMTVDNRILSLLVGDTSGVKSIAKDFKNFGKNLGQIYKNITKNNIIVQSINYAVKNKDKNIIDGVKQYVNDTNKQEIIQNNKKLVNELNGETNLSDEDVKKSLSNIAQIMNENGETLKDLQISNIDGNIAGLSYVDKEGKQQTITINLANVDLADPNDIMKVITHETTNIKDHHNNEKLAETRSNMNIAIFDMLNYGNENTNAITTNEWLIKHSDSSIIREGNKNLVNNVVRASNGDGTADAFSPTMAGCTMGGAVGCAIGAAVDTGLAVAGSAAAAASSPVIIGGLIVVAVGAGAYKIYNAYSAKDNNANGSVSQGNSIITSGNETIPYTTPFPLGDNYEPNIETFPLSEPEEQNIESFPAGTKEGPVILPGVPLDGEKTPNIESFPASGMGAWNGILESVKTDDNTKEVIGTATPTDHKGKSEIYEKNGGWEAGMEDLKKIAGGREVIPGTTHDGNPMVRTTDENGQNVILREDSSDGRITLEVQEINGQERIKVRYND